MYPLKGEVLHVRGPVQRLFSDLQYCGPVHEPPFTGTLYAYLLMKLTSLIHKHIARKNTNKMSTILIKVMFMFNEKLMLFPVLDISQKEQILLIYR
jgi:hypothetical protein